MQRVATLALLVASYLLGCGLTARGLAAQDSGRPARIVLENGRVLYADVLQVDADRFVIEVDGRRTELPRDAVERVELSGDGAAAAESATAWEGRDGEVTDAEGDLHVDDGSVPVDDDTAAVGSSPQAEAGGAGGASDAEASESAKPLGPDARVIDLIDRYVWVVPTDSGHLSSFGGLLLLAAAALIRFAAGLGGIERASFGQCLGLAAVLLAVLAIETTVVPAVPLVMAIVLAADLGGFWLCTSLFLRASPGSSAFVVAVFAFSLLLGVLLTELVAVLTSAEQLL